VKQLLRSLTLVASAFVVLLALASGAAAQPLIYILNGNDQRFLPSTEPPSLSIVNSATGHTVGRITTGGTTGSIAVAGDGTRAYVANGNAVLVIDLTNLEITREVVLRGVDSNGEADGIGSRFFVIDNSGSVP
jgi:DNA-binding beta-propeller fold protein YncE